MMVLIVALIVSIIWIPNAVWDKPYPLRFLRGFAMGATGYLVQLIIKPPAVKSLLLVLSAVVVILVIIEGLLSYLFEKGKPKV